MRRNCLFLLSGASVAVRNISATGSVLVTNGAIITDNNTVSSNSKTVSNTGKYCRIPSIGKHNNRHFKTNDIYKELADNTGNKYLYRLKNNVVIKRRTTDTLFIDISFTASAAPEEAKALTNKF